jgi:hypothetical protein
VIGGNYIVSLIRSDLGYDFVLATPGHEKTTIFKSVVYGGYELRKSKRSITRCQKVRTWF